MDGLKSYLHSRVYCNCSREFQTAFIQLMKVTRDRNVLCFFSTNCTTKKVKNEFINFMSLSNDVS